MKRKEIAKRAIALTACMVMCVTSIPVNLFADAAGAVAAEAKEYEDSGSSAGMSGESGGESGGTDVSEPEGNSGESGGTDVEEPGGNGGESGGTDVSEPGGNGGESGGTDVEEPGGNGGESGGTDVSEPGGNSGESGGTDVSEPGGNSGESGGTDVAEPDGSTGQEGDSGQDGKPGDKEQTDKENPEEPSRTTAIDWTNNMDVLGVSLNQIDWESADSAGSCQRNEQGQWDLSSLYEGAAETVTLNYTISMTNDSNDPLLPGDTFSIALPSSLFAVQPDSGSLNPEQEKPVASYTTGGSNVQVTLTDAAGQEGFGGFQAALAVKTKPFPYEPGESHRIENMVIQRMTDVQGNLVKENKVEFFLPAKAVEEPGKDDNGEGTPIEKPDGDNPDGGKNDEKPDGNNPEDGKNDEKPDGNNPEDGKNDEKPDGDNPDGGKNDKKPGDNATEDGETEGEASNEEPKDLTGDISVDFSGTEIEVEEDYAVDIPVTYTIPKATEIQPKDSFILSIDGMALLRADATAASASVLEESSPMVLTSGAADISQEPTEEEPGTPDTPETPDAPETPDTPETPDAPETPDTPKTETVNLPEKTEISVASPVIRENQVTTVFTEPAVAAAELQGTIQLRGAVTRQDVENGKASLSIQGKSFEIGLLALKTGEETKEVSFTKEWIGASPKEGWPDLLETGMVQIFYKLGADEQETQWKPNDLGIAAWNKEGNYSVDSSQGVGFQTYKLTVPKKYKNQEVTYSFKENETVARAKGYIPVTAGTVAPNGTFKNVEATTFEAILDINDGDIHNGLEFFRKNLTLYKKIDGKETELGKLDSLPAGVTAEMENGKLVISGLPRYTEEQLELSYCIKADSEILCDAVTGDKYLPTYDNSASSNFGSVTDACHSGGTLTLLLTGETKYVGHKIWVDDGKEGTIATRPSGILYLWRYSGKDADYKTASQVKSLQDGTKNIEWELDTQNQTSDYEMEQLAKYDPDGYPYTYFIKEILKGTTVDGKSASGYEQKMGAVSEDADGNVTFRDIYRGPEKVRPEGDFSVYHEGTLSNRRTEIVPQTVTKVWDAASFQNQLDNVTVIMGLEGRRKGAVPEADWKPVGEVQKISGFFAEQLSQTINTSVNKYDEMGCEMEFRWVEKDVEQRLEDDTLFDTDFKMVRIEEENKETGTFNLKHGEEVVKYKSEYNPDVNVMTNSLEATTDYAVEKIWKGFPGAAADGKTPPVDGAEITIKLYRNDDLYTTFIMDGTAEAQPSELLCNGVQVKGTGQEISPYVVKFNDLPKYNSAGRKYIYVAEEEPYVQSGVTWHTTYEYDVVQERTATITNEPTGEGKVIRVCKKWLDDSDVEHRVPVTVEVYEMKGDTQDLKNDVLIETVTLTSRNNWWKEVGIEKTVNPDKCYIREVSTPSCTDKVNMEEGQMFVEGGIAYTKHHMYQVTGGTERDKRGMLYITNRRIGIVNMTVTKKWIDGDGALNDRPKDLELKLHCAEETDAINYTDNTISFGFDSLQIKTVDTDGNAIDGAAIQPVASDADKTEFTYHFNNLPKYDAEGKVVHYTITEEDAKGSLGQSEYIASVTYDSYQVGDAQHTNDSQTVTVTNRKSKSKGIRFHKLWKDKYAFEEGKRPDIYLSLYQTSVKDGVTEIIPVEGYRDYLWTRDVTDSDTKWTCDFGQLPKYDSAGNVITYYARELTHVDAGALGYDTSDTAVMDTGNTYAGEYLQDADDSNTTKEITVDGGKLLVLKENGTFVNKLTGTIIIDGKKVWKNIPTGIPFEDFPELEIQADRTTTKPLSQRVFVDVKKLVRTVRPNASPLLITPQGKAGGADPNLETKVAYTTLTKQNRVPGTNDFTFKMTVNGENDAEGNSADNTGMPLPKYDKDGALYYYSVAETVISNVENLENTTYDALPGEVNNFIITNTYSVAEKNTGKLSVSKTWSGISPGQLGTGNGKYQYPAADFTLYRQYKSNDVTQNTENGMTEPEMVGSPQRLSSAAVESGVTVEFDGLRVMAPNGTKYHYYVEETLLNGYNTSGTKITIDKITYQSEKKTLEESLPGQKDFQAKVTFTNEYTPADEKIQLHGRKEWKDNSNIFGTRPSLADFKSMYTVYRYADEQPGEGGAPAIGDETVTLQEGDPKADYYLQWTDTDKDTWTYTLSNLERYAPNSMPWKYKITEQKVEGYPNSDNQIIDSANGQIDDKGNIEMPEWTNDGLTSASVEKKWADDSYGLRPASIEVELYAKKGTNGVWKQASVLFNEDKSLGINLPETLADAKLKCTIGAADNWEHKFNGLPAYVKDSSGKIVAYNYQVVEIKIGDYSVDTSNIFSSGTAVYPETGPYKISAVVDDKKTTITNTYGKDNKYLKIVKTWAGDSTNNYNTRPSENGDWYADFALYRKVGNNEWQPYRNTDNDNIILRVKGENTQDSVAMGFGPFPKFAENGSECSYAAVEIKPTQDAADVGSSNYTKSEIITVGGQELNDTFTAPTDNFTLPVSGTPLSVEQGITYDTMVETTNSLLTTSLTVTKNWNDGSVKEFRPEKLTMQFQRKIVNPTGSDWETVTYQSKINWNKQGNTWTATFSNLPAYTPEGKAYVYRAVETQVSNYQPPVSTETDKGSQPDISQTMTITNKISEFEVSKILTGGTDSSKLPIGARLEIYKAAGGTVTGDAVASWECTGNNGSAQVETTVMKTGKSIWSDQVPVAAAPAKGVIKGLDVGDYVLRETIAPAGYETAADIPFTLGSDGKTITLTTGGVVSEDNGIYCITMTDQKAAVKIQKINLDGTELTGAEFTITGVFANKTGQQTLSEDGANSAGYLISSNTSNPEHIYTLSETKAPEGYIKSDADTTFWVDETGGVQITSNNVVQDNIQLAGTAPNDTEKIIYRNAPVQISLEKHDKSQNVTSALEGAVFTLTDKGTDGNGTKVLSDSITTASGSLLLNGLIQGHDYSLTETKAPDGYILPAENKRTYTFQVSEAGKVTNLTGTAGFWELSKNDTLIKIFNNPIVLNLVKTDNTDNAKIEGTVFTLHDTASQGTAGDKTVKTDSNGELTLKGPADGLIQGHTYKLTETPAPGYEQSENRLKITFAVNNDGTIAVKEVKDGSDADASQRVIYPLEENDTAIGVKNIRQNGSVEILKVDADDITTVLPGAVFQLQKKSNQGVYENIGEPITTGTDGKARIECLEWGEYRIKEIKPPSGYALSETTFDFTISAASLTASYTDAGGTFENEKTNVRILKKAEGSTDDTTLDGAKFAIYQLSAPDGEPAGTPIWESSGNSAGTPGTIQLSGVFSVDTWYAIVETSAPAGYEKLKQHVVLKLNEKGQCITFDNQGETRWTVEPPVSNPPIQKLITPVTVTAADSPLNMNLYKVADGSTQNNKSFLEGAELTVSGDFKDATETAVIINEDNFDKNPLKGKLLAGKTYTVTETAAPTGYTKFTGTITFSLNEYGEISQCEVKEAGETAATAYDSTKYTTNTIWIHDTPLNTDNVHPQIRKADDAGTPIEGISFLLSGKLGNDVNAERTLTSDENGNLLTDSLLAEMHVGETYTLTEKYQEPSSYEELTGDIQFQIDDNGQIKLKQDNTQAASVSNNMLKIVNTRTSFHISKVDAKNNKLAGAGLTIYTNKAVNGKDQPGDIAKDLTGAELQWTTAADTAKTVTGLATGTYWLVETRTPEGYQTAAPVKFILDKEGKASSPDSVEAISNDGLSITMQDKEVRGHVILTKTEAGTDTGINGAEFTLYKLSAGALAPNPETDTRIAEKLTTEETAATDPDAPLSGIWSSESSETINSDTGEALKNGLRAGTYYFVETKAPDHYQFDSTPSQRFVINGDVTETELSGSVTAEVITNPKAPIQVKMSNSLISAQEHQRFLTIYKEDAENQEALADAVFTLERIKDMNGIVLKSPEPVTVDGAAEVKTVIGTDGKASITFGPLTDKGTYRLTEKTAPDGYDLIHTVQEYDVVVTDHKAEDLESWEGSLRGGKIQLKLLEKDTKNPITDNIVKNQRLTGSVSLKKVDEDGITGLNDVAFKLLYKDEGTEDFQEIKYSFNTGNSYGMMEGKTWNKDIIEADVTKTSLADTEAGVLKITDLPWGSYCLQETHQLPGYMNKAESFEFEIGRKQSTDGENQGAGGIHHILNVTTGYGADGQPAWEEAADGHIMTLTNEKTRVSFIKRMKDEMPGLAGMKGAGFSLKGKFADSPDTVDERKWTTAEAPEMLEGLLIAGETYTLTETKAPEGALPANNFQVKFTMNADGTLTALDENQPDNGNSDAEAKLTAASGSDPACITVLDAPVTMKVFKKGTDTTGSGTEDILLKGCTFEVTGRFAPDRGTYRSASEKNRLVKTTFALNSSSHLEESDSFGGTDNLHASAGQETITVTTTGRDDTDMYNALSGRLIVGETYTIKEIIPPAGYAVGLGVSFTLQEKKEVTGKVTAEIVLNHTGNNYDIIQDKNGSPVIIQRDNPVGLKLHKVGSNRPSGLNGAKFTLSGIKLVDGKEAGSLLSQELESTRDEGAAGREDGWIDLTGKVNETNTDTNGVKTEYRYTLKETQAPSGYSRAEDITFRIESGKQEGSNIPVSRFILLNKEGNPVSYGSDGKYSSPYTYLSKTSEAVTINKKQVEIDIISITNQYNPPVYVDSHTVEKVWDDKDNEAGKRPADIEVKLLDENNKEVPYAPTVTLNEGNGWKYTWYGLSKYNSYHAVEVTDLTGTGYTAVMAQEEKKTIITNTYKAAEPSQTPTPTPEITPTKKPAKPTATPKPTAEPSPTGKPVSPTAVPQPSETPGATAVPTNTTAPGQTGGNGSSTSGGNNHGTDDSSNTTRKDPTKTGDETSTMFYLFLLVASAAVITGYRRKIRRK